MAKGSKIRSVYRMHICCGPVEVAEGEGRSELRLVFFHILSLLGDQVEAPQACRERSRNVTGGFPEVFLLD